MLSRFYWKATAFQFTCLSFGLATVPRVFTKTLHPVVDNLHLKGIRSVIYMTSSSWLRAKLKLPSSVQQQLSCSSSWGSSYTMDMVFSERHNSMSSVFAWQTQHQCRLHVSPPQRPDRLDSQSSFGLHHKPDVGSSTSGPIYNQILTTVAKILHILSTPPTLLIILIHVHGHRCVYHTTHPAYQCNTLIYARTNRL